MRHSRVLLHTLTSFLVLLQGCGGPELVEGEIGLESVQPVRVPRWEPLGGELNPSPAGYAGRPALVSRPRTSPTLALGVTDPDTAASSTVTLRLGGERWRPLGAPLGSSGPSLASDRHGHVYLCTGGGPFVYRLSGSRWTAIGGDISSETGYRSPRYQVSSCGGIALAADDTPIVTWTAHQGPKADFVYAARFSEEHAQWQGLGPGAFSGRSDVRSLGLDGSGRPYLVTFSAGGSYGGGNTTRAWRFDGGSWTQLGESRVDTHSPVLAASGNTVLLAVQERASQQITVQSFYDGAWSSLPGPGPGVGEPGALELTPLGRPVLAYVEGTGPSTIRVKHWVGSEWQELGNDVAIADGTVTGLSLALDPRGRPIVAFTAASLDGTRHSTKALRYTVPLY